MDECPVCGGTGGCCCGRRWVGGFPYEHILLHLLVICFLPVLFYVTWLFDLDARGEAAAGLAILTVLAVVIVRRKPAFWRKIPATWKVVFAWLATIVLGFFWALVIFKE
jgi:hypothetical protein